jgi:glucose-1-phosphate cytidylyltransferase
MKVAILAGGQGTRLAEETEVRPKPMVEIGGRPIIWHIMRHYDHYGYSEFVVALGYKGDVIKRYFADYHASNLSMRVHVGVGDVEVFDDGPVESWTVDLIETGRWTNTGGRVRRMIDHLGGETFVLTHGDGVNDVDIDSLLEFHRDHGKIATVTAVHPPPRYGQLILDGDRILEFNEKPLDSSWINGGLWVLEPEIVDYIDSDDTLFEREPMQRLAKDGQLMAYQHAGFWQCMDTLREKQILNDLWDGGQPPWRIWD